MGEIAEMMLDGTLCEQCGTYMGEGDGFLRVCSYCRKRSSAERKAACPKCNKRVKAIGLAQHMRDAHKEKA